MKNMELRISPPEQQTTPPEKLNDDDAHEEHHYVLNPCWSSLTERCLHQPLRKFVVSCAMRAAKRPFLCVVSLSLVSMVVACVGLLTNFSFEADQFDVFTPTGSKPALHHAWIRETFPETRQLTILVHAHGENLAAQASLPKALQGALDVVNTVRYTPGYFDLCQESNFVNLDGERTCRLSSITEFWNHNQTLLQQAVEVNPDSLPYTLAQPDFPNGIPVYREFFFGYPQFETSPSTIISDDADNTNNPKEPEEFLSYCVSFVINFEMPELHSRSDEWEERALSRLSAVQQTWAQVDDDPSSTIPPLGMDFYSMYGFALEYERAVLKDIPLVMLVFFIMSIFTCVVFFRKDPVESRSMVGLFSIGTIAMSIMMGHGIMFIAGVPFSSISQMIPFVVFGIGLDDTFIITGSYYRHLEEEQGSYYEERTIEERLELVMNEVGLSISLTTLTTVLAFALGGLSSVPGIRWLCLYAGSTVAVDFLYQITLFVALLVLDERRVLANRKAWFIWQVVTPEEDTNQALKQHAASRPRDNNNEPLPNESESDHTIIHKNSSIEKQHTSNHRRADAYTQDELLLEERQLHLSNRFMEWYAVQLLRPWVRLVVLVIFAALFVGNVYSTLLLTQEFKAEDLVPDDSYVKSFFESFDEYSSLVEGIGVYFRNVNQSDPATQVQMLMYVDELARSMDQIGSDQPEFFWLRDFAERGAENADLVQGMTFAQKVDLALRDPVARQVYGPDIVRDNETGEVIASRCTMFLNNLDLSSIQEQMDLLLEQRAFNEEHLVNANKDDWDFFTFDDLYLIWELYVVTVDELILTTLSGVSAVSLIGFLILPHWSALFFVCPLIVMLYFDLLGMMQFFGIHINSVSYVIIVMSIGLLVDFLMHMLLKYYETTGRTREEKVKEALGTMGASILLGGLTTLLGVLPLCLSTTQIFNTVFISFFLMVALGCGTGLILLPVLLSIVGPIEHMMQDSNYDYDDDDDDDDDEHPTVVMTPRSAAAASEAGDSVTVVPIMSGTSPKSSMDSNLDSFSSRVDTNEEEAAAAAVAAAAGDKDQDKKDGLVEAELMDQLTQTVYSIYRSVLECK